MTLKEIQIRSIAKSFSYFANGVRHVFFFVLVRCIENVIHFFVGGDKMKQNILINIIITSELLNNENTLNFTDDDYFHRIKGC